MEIELVSINQTSPLHWLLFLMLLLLSLSVGSEIKQLVFPWKMGACGGDDGCFFPRLDVMCTKSIVSKFWLWQLVQKSFSFMYFTEIKCPPVLLLQLDLTSCWLRSQTLVWLSDHEGSWFCIQQNGRVFRWVSQIHFAMKKLRRFNKFTDSLLYYKLLLTSFNVFFQSNTETKILITTFNINTSISEF